MREDARKYRKRALDVRAGKGPANRTEYVDYEPKNGLTPKLTAEFLGLEKATSFTRTQARAELKARGLKYKENGADLPHSQMKAMLVEQCSDKETGLLLGGRKRPADDAVVLESDDEDEVFSFSRWFRVW